MIYGLYQYLYRQIFWSVCLSCLSTCKLNRSMPLSLEHTPVFFPFIVSLMTLTSKVGLFAYQVLNGKLIVPAGCGNSSVMYCSVFSPFACAAAAIEYRIALAFASFAVLLKSHFFRPIAVYARLLSGVHLLKGLYVE